MPELPESEAIESIPEAPPSKYHDVKKRTVVAVFLAVWVPAGAIGVGLYYWWFHSLNKTLPVFVVLVFVIGCTVAALLLAMAAHRPLIAAVAIAVVSAPCAAVLGAAPLHGTYYCEKSVPPIRCLAGVLPY